MKTQTQKYENLIKMLENYVEGTIKHCNVIMQASTDCVEFLHGDPVALDRNSNLQRCVENIQLNIELIMGIIKVLKEEGIEGVPPDWYLEQHPEWYDESQ